MSTTAAISTTSTAWTLDQAHSSVGFAVRHLMITTVRGRFAEVTGTVVTDAADPTNVAVDVTIQAASIDTREPQRDAHLRSADFFDVERFPTLTFKSRRVEDVRGDERTLIGDLTIRDVTREVALTVTAHGTARDPWGNERSGFEATTKISRSDFGLTWNQALELGGVAVADEVKIAIDAQLIKQQ